MFFVRFDLERFNVLDDEARQIEQNLTRILTFVVAIYKNIVFSKNSQLVVYTISRLRLDESAYCRLK